MKCFYHGCDFDGKCSAAIVKLQFPECELIPINYGDQFPWELIGKDEVIYMVDFTIQPYNNMCRLKELCDLIWIDHHKTSIDWAKDNDFNCRGLRNTDFAACELTWMYFCRPTDPALAEVRYATPMPRAVKLLGRYDVWDHKDVDVLPFQYGMKCEAESPENMRWWDMLLQDRSPVSVGNLISVGRFCQKYQEREDAAACKSSGFDLEWEGLRWTVINGPCRGSSVHKSRFDPFAHDAMLGFWWNGKQWLFSLTTSKDIDLSAIAKKYGGGGHKGSAGFEAAELPFRLCVPRSREEVIKALANVCLKT